jgi:hypothetical protein
MYLLAVHFVPLLDSPAHSRPERHFTTERLVLVEGGRTIKVHFNADHSNQLPLNVYALLGIRGDFAWRDQFGVL